MFVSRGSSARLPRLSLTFACAFLAIATVAPADAGQRKARLSDDLVQLVRGGDATPTEVIVTGTAEQVDGVAARHGLRIRKRLQAGAVVEVPAGSLAAVAADEGIDLVTSNQRVTSHMAITNEALGATVAWAGARNSGVTGKGVGVAVIDSGIADVANLKGKVRLTVDLTDARGKGLDQWGHGTFVAGLIAASPKGKGDTTSGVAPDAHLINIKVLGADGSGFVADVIEGIDYVVANRSRLKVDVINLSLGATPQQSWRDDPLCAAVERAHDAGIVVVAAAGNRGRTDDGTAVYGTINSPGHCPHAITVGALNTKQTAARSDDVMATYSSKGPTRDGLIKPDVVAPGNKILGLLAPGSTLAAKYPELVEGTKLRLSGTSMAAAAVSGAVALLKESNTRYSPATVRLALQYSAQPMVADGLLKSGAGSVNVLAALSMPYPETAAFIAGESVATSRISFGVNGTAAIGQATNILWGDGADNILWGDARDNILWGDARDNILWGDARDNILWGDARDNILWGDARDNILWGDARDNILWGDARDNILWGDARDNILWGDAADNILWGDAADNILWGDAADNILWGDAADNILWGD